MMNSVDEGAFAPSTKAGAARLRQPRGQLKNAIAGAKDE